MIYVLLFLLIISPLGCSYRIFPGSLVPLSETEQLEAMRVSDDGTVTYTKDRLEIALRPMTDEELNRQFSGVSAKKAESTNPYTFGDWKPARGERTPQRFTVFLLKVKNYAYPKVRVYPSKIRVAAKNGRRYSSLGLMELKGYYYPYLTAYAGNPYKQFDERNDILQQTFYPPSDFVFSGQEQEGYVVFPRLDDDVRQITVVVEGIELRYDFKGAPVETLDISFLFHRDLYRESANDLVLFGEEESGKR